MIQVNKTVQLKEVKSVESHKPATGFRFDIFKGSKDGEGKVTKLRSMGSAYLRDGHKTYSVNLKTFLNEHYFLLPNSNSDLKADYVILTREPAKNIARKYFWNPVGHAVVLDGGNHGLMKLSWDVLADDIYMCLHPIAARASELIDTAA